MGIWTPASKGVRYREHPSRKHGKKPDRYWCIQYRLHGRNINEAVGWWSAGATQGQCEELLATLRVNHKNGQGPQTLKEMREHNKARRAAEIAERDEAQSRERTFHAFWEAEYLPYAKLSISEQTLKSSSHCVSHRLKPLADMLISEISPVVLEDRIIRAMLEDGCSPTYVEKVLRVFSVIWMLAKKRGFVTGDNPVSKVKIPKSDGRRDRFLSKDEATELLKRLADRFPLVHDAALLSLFSGLRIGECLSLTWADVDFDQETIFVKETKNSKNRHAYMTEEIRTMLVRRFAGQPKTAAVFPSAMGGNGYSDLSQKFNKVRDEIGLNNGITDDRQKVVVHTLRHTFASWLVQKGTPLYTVSQLMGHSSLAMTMRYAHLAPDTKRAAAMDLQGILD